MKPAIAFLLVLFGVVGAFTATAARVYPGSWSTLVVFALSCSVLLALIVPSPRCYAYTFLATFLFLGFWVKTVAHLLSGQDFVEPVGNFDHSPLAWDLALRAATAAAIGVALARGLQLVYFWLRAAGGVPSPDGRVPDLYRRHRKPVWALSMALILGLNGWNIDAAFYQIGVNPRTVLPLHLNVLTGWLINIGFALWLAVLLHWEYLVAPRNLPRALLAVVAEAFIAGASTLSRGVYLFRTAPYFVSIAEMRRAVRNYLTMKTVAALALAALVALAINLGTVQVLRTYAYYGEESVALPQSEAAGTPRNSWIDLPQAALQSTNRATRSRFSWRVSPNRRRPVSAPRPLKGLDALGTVGPGGLESLEAFCGPGSESAGTRILGIESENPEALDLARR